MRLVLLLVLITGLALAQPGCGTALSVTVSATPQLFKVPLDFNGTATFHGDPLLCQWNLLAPVGSSVLITFPAGFSIYRDANNQFQDSDMISVYEGPAPNNNGQPAMTVANMTSLPLLRRVPIDDGQSFDGIKSITTATNQAIVLFKGTVGQGFVLSVQQTAPPGRRACSTYPPVYSCTFCELAGPSCRACAAGNLNGCPYADDAENREGFANYCVDCLPGFVQTGDGRCRCPSNNPNCCPSGQFADTNGVCKHCYDPNCATCTGLGAGECTVCAPGSYLKFGACFPCATAGCTDCTNVTTCLESCKVGFSPGTCECAPCTYHCEVCSSSTVCATCEASYYVTAGGDCAQCSGALEPYTQAMISACFPHYMSGGQYELCSDANCLNCSAAYQCDACSAKNGKHLATIPVGQPGAGGTYCAPCQGQTGTDSCYTCTDAAAPTCTGCQLYDFLGSDTWCYPCDNAFTHCFMCSTYGNCTMCDGFMYLYDEHASRHDTRYIATGTCNECPENCRRCEFDDGYLSCYLPAPGYYNNVPMGRAPALYSVFPCPTPNCATCLGGVCSTCKPGFRFDNPTNTCIACPAACATCNATSCLTCESTAYRLTGGQCLACQPSKCGCCDAATGACLACEAGYSLSADGTTCDWNNCATQYCAPGKCVYPTGCTECMKGSYADPTGLSGFSCYSLCYEGCTECLLSASYCTACNTSAYHLDPVNHICLHGPTMDMSSTSTTQGDVSTTAAADATSAGGTSGLFGNVSPVLVFALIGAAILLIALIAICIIIQRRRSKKPAAKSSAPEPASSGGAARAPPAPPKQV